MKKIVLCLGMTSVLALGASAEDRVEATIKSAPRPANVTAVATGEFNPVSVEVAFHAALLSALTAPATSGEKAVADPTQKFVVVVSGAGAQRTVSLKHAGSLDAVKVWTLDDAALAQPGGQATDTAIAQISAAAGFAPAGVQMGFAGEAQDLVGRAQ